MTVFQRMTSVSAVTLLFAFSVGSAVAAEIKANTLEQTDPNKKTAEVQANWKRTTWEAYERQLQLKGSRGTAEIPPTDCPPEPPEVCLATWDDELTSE